MEAHGCAGEGRGLWPAGACTDCVAPSLAVRFDTHTAEPDLEVECSVEGCVGEQGTTWARLGKVRLLYLRECDGAPEELAAAPLGGQYQRMLDDGLRHNATLVYYPGALIVSLDGVQLMHARVTLTAADVPLPPTAPLAHSAVANVTNGTANGTAAPTTVTPTAAPTAAPSIGSANDTAANASNFTSTTSTANTVNATASSDDGASTVVEQPLVAGSSHSFAPLLDAAGGATMGFAAGSGQVARPVELLAWSCDVVRPPVPAESEEDRVLFGAFGPPEITPSVTVA
jgi:hypothetical protein